MSSYISTAKIKFVFMTDGGCGYPGAQVTKIKALKNSNANKF